MSRGRYRRLSLAEREEISRAMLYGKSIRCVSRQLGRSPSTISREVRHIGSRCAYRAGLGHRRARSEASGRRRGKHKLARNPQLRQFVTQRLSLYWSPEQIVHALKTEYPNNSTMRVSEGAIYSYLYILPRGELKKRLVSQLRRGHSRRHTRKMTNRRPTIEGMVSIEDRPFDIENRQIPGHWEGDILLGKSNQSFLGTLVERKTRMTLLVRLKDKSADTVRLAFQRKMVNLPTRLRKSITYDQGREMAEHLLFTERTKIKIYFAHPASPWERGTNENTNGLIRQFFPHGTDLNRVSLKRIKRVEKLLNERPRKILKFQTPYEAYQQVLQ